MTKLYDFDGNDGCVSIKRARETGRPVGIYRNDQAGLDSGNGEYGDEYPWSTVCEDHGHVIAHPNLALARAHAANPLGWCEACMDEARDKE